jgi:WD40 repeat protein
MPQLQLVADLPGHPSPAWQVSFNPTRPILASCSTDKTFRLYSYNLPPPSSSLDANTPFPPANSAKPQFNFLQSVQTEHKKSVRSICWAPSGRTLATGSFDSTVGIWEEGDEEEDDDGDGVFQGVVRPKRVEKEEEEDGDEDEEGEGGVKVREWECVTTLEGHESECKSVAFSSDGGLLGSCSRDKSVWVWEGESAVNMLSLLEMG